MNCEHFLEHYSDFVDGVLPDDDAAECTGHQDTCPSCAKYARVMEEGVDLLRKLPTAEPASDFAPRLRHRLYHVEDDIPWAAAHPGGSAAILAVAAVGFLSLFWLPFAAQIPVEVEFAPVAVDAPESPAPPSLLRAGPFFGPRQPLLPLTAAATRTVQPSLLNVQSPAPAADSTEASP